MPRRLRDRSMVMKGLTAASALALMTACVHQGKPTVSIDKLQASLVFGVKPPAPKSLASPPPVDTSQDTSADETPPSDTLVQFKKAPLFVPPSPKQPACPDPPDGASADRNLDVSATAMPAPGLYRYHDSGFETVSLGTTTTQVKISGFEHRAIAHVAGTEPFTYDFYRPAANSEIQVDHMQVKNNGAQVNPSAGVGTVGTPREGDPERGVVLKGRDFIDSKTGNTTGTGFRPTTGLLLLPLPVSAGEAFQSVAVDSVHGRTIVLQGTAKGPFRANACGQVIDGWLVDATVQDSAGGTGASFEWLYAISPQYGGIIIHEETKTGADTTKPDTDTISEIGQLTPDPLPPGF
jgi:hypothetical protein